jgi:hypothetical protein
MLAAADGRPVPAVTRLKFALYDEKDVPALGVVMALDAAAGLENIGVDLNFVLLVDKRSTNQHAIFVMKHVMFINHCVIFVIGEVRNIEDRRRLGFAHDFSP